MEPPPFVALSLNFVVFSILVCVWRVLNYVWLRPKKLERCLRKQGLKGNSYRLMTGDMKDSYMMLKQAQSKPINLSSCHDIAARVIPYVHQTVKKYGSNSFTWNGTRPKVNITNPEDIKAIFDKHDKFHKVVNPITTLLVSGFAIYEGEKWARHRTIINPAFHAQKLKAMLPAVFESCSDMITEWVRLVTEKGQCELDVWPYLQNLTGDVISRTAFGSSYKEGLKIFQLLREQAVLVTKAAHLVIIPGWRFLPTKLNKRMKQNAKEVQDLLEDVINKRKEATRGGEATKDDLLGILLESNSKVIQEDGNSKNIGLSRQDIIDECKLFYFGGQETTSVLVVWTMVLLCQNPIWQTRAREEVMQVFGSKRPDFQGMTQLKVMTMVLREVLRLYPPIASLNRTAYKKTQLGTLSLPSGVEISIPTLLIHHNKNLWGDDADEFKPERFSEGVSKATRGQISFFPFGAGPRICIGQNFAMMEAKIVLSLILQHFVFELSPSYAHAPSSFITVQPQYGVHIMLYKR
ncbi:cytochrome P450 CYP72A219-like [Argentina anserina]|uniref:cytochrome P450 CYP72A219-like n=1 Tax=Argentina anserina TaxID=57926 RepID=UPI0021764E5C|nr:cytochrome P450 CYP72A219-like [Potentilla anserina]